MEIKQGTRSFYIGDSEDKPLAEMTYVVSGKDLIIIDHTFVGEELGGQGIGKRLLEKVTDWARKENKKIVPVCPYAKAQMEKNEAYNDLLVK